MFQLEFVGLFGRGVKVNSADVSIASTADKKDI